MNGKKERGREGQEGREPEEWKEIGMERKNGRDEKGKEKKSYWNC